MKKLLIIAIAINLVACTNDNKETTPTPIAAVKTNSFNPNPTPEDYKNANYPDFNLPSSTAKVLAIAAVYVNTYVPDAAFRTRLVSLGAATDPVPGDNYVSIDKTRGGLDLSNAGISDLTGIQAYTSLAQLVASYNNLTTLDISALTNLGVLECQGNKLTSLNLATNTKLYQIWCFNNLLTSLTLPTSTTTLWGIWCYGNQLTSLDLKANYGITDLFIQSNLLTSTSINLTSKYINLKQINCSANKWVTFSLNAFDKLTFVCCYSNTLLTDLYIRNPDNTIIINQDFRYNTKAPKYTLILFLGHKQTGLKEGVLHMLIHNIILLL